VKGSERNVQESAMRELDYEAITGHTYSLMGGGLEVDGRLPPKIGVQSKRRPGLQILKKEPSMTFIFP
jgi:hypothetical protein